MGRMTHDAAICVLETELERTKSAIDWESGKDYDCDPDFLHSLCWEEEAYRMSISALRKIWKLDED